MPPSPDGAENAPALLCAGECPCGCGSASSRLGSPMAISRHWYESDPAMVLVRSPTFFTSSYARVTVILREIHFIC